MTNKSLYKFEGLEYTVRRGIILDPGKFEGEPVFVLLYYSLGMDGGADEDDEGVWWFTLSDEDRADYPDLGNATQLAIWTDDQGFVHHKLSGVQP